MIEPIVVDVPTIFPQACSCGNQHGPLIDTHRERNGVHEYVCLRCAQTYARIFGFAPGNKLEELAKAAQAVAEREREVEGLRQQLKDEREDSELKDRAIDGLKAERDKLSGRVDQLEDRISTVAEELVA